MKKTQSQIQWQQEGCRMAIVQLQITIQLNSIVLISLWLLSNPFDKNDPLKSTDKYLQRNSPESYLQCQNSNLVSHWSTGKCLSEILTSHAQDKKFSNAKEPKASHKWKGSIPIYSTSQTYAIWLVSINNYPENLIKDNPLSATATGQTQRLCLDKIKQLFSFTLLFSRIKRNRFFFLLYSMSKGKENDMLLVIQMPHGLRRISS